MSPGLGAGVGLTLASGLLAGNCMLPMKFVRGWAWENTWLVFTIVSLIVLPWGLALALVPQLGSVYAGLPAQAYVFPLLFGFGWGIAQALFGISIARLGMALGYAIIIGLGALLGTLVPLVVKNRSVITTLHGMLILTGMLVMVSGIAVAARAGQMRESEGQNKRGDYRGALVLAIACGLMAPMLNYSFAFGDAIAEQAIKLGTASEAAGYAVWPVGLFGGLIPNLVYCLWLLRSNQSWGKFRSRFVENASCGTLMGAFWMGAMALYGVSSVWLGVLGTSVGWALFQIFMIITANLSGVVAGEWRSASIAAKRRLWGGLSLLAIATALIAAGNYH
jgi:L-rhamnose-H+ transport protein